MHPQLIEELDHHHPSLSELYAEGARLTGACCATFYAGGDCAHTMGHDEPTFEEMVEMGWALDGAGLWVEVGDLCSVIGRPVPPIDLEVG